MTDTRALIAQAHGLQQQGRLQQAATLYQEVLQREPRNADALHLLGLLMASAGQGETAVSLLSAAVQVQPANAAVQTNLGIALSGMGRFAEALPCFERALALEPALAVAHRSRGVAQMRLGQLQAALTSFDAAVRLAPADDTALNGLGVVLERAGRVQQARQSFNQALALNPNNVEAHHNLALLEAATGNHAGALASLERALQLQPNNPVLRANQATQLLALGRDAEALANIERAIATQPGDATAHYNRGLALLQLGRDAEAVGSFDRALQLAPNLAQAPLWSGKAYLKLNRPADALARFDRSLELAESFDAHFQRGIALTLLERHEESVASFDQAIALDDKSAEAFNNRGAVLVRRAQMTEALADFAQATRLNPNYADAHVNTGNTLRGLGRYDEALRSLDRALTMKPDDLTALWTKALVTLAKGDFREGWPLYESRLRRPNPKTQLQRTLEAPRWTGDEPLQGKTLFVHAEQGLGDTLQFCRYIPLLEALGASVVFETQPVLRRILGSLGMRGTLICRGEAIPKHDLQIPLLSVPLAMHTQLETIPVNVPYLHTEPESLQTWRTRLRALAGFKVGILWQGNPEAERLSPLEARSFPLACAAPLAQLPGVTLVSLQKGPGAEQRGQVEFSERIAQLTDPLYLGADEIATETAPLIKALDLVITADTALAHLAGALGAPVWLVLQAVPDWRWLIDRSDSPWYPTMRLFRQRRHADWDGVFDRLAAALAAECSNQNRQEGSAS
jgi:tetratricopeptide (TPR) repeat protein